MSHGGYTIDKKGLAKSCSRRKTIGKHRVSIALPSCEVQIRYRRWQHEVKTMATRTYRMSTRWSHDGHTVDEKDTPWDHRLYILLVRVAIVFTSCGHRRHRAFSPNDVNKMDTRSLPMVSGRLHDVARPSHSHRVTLCDTCIAMGSRCH